MTPSAARAPAAIARKPSAAVREGARPRTSVGAAWQALTWSLPVGATRRLQRQPAPRGKTKQQALDNHREKKTQVVDLLLRCYLQPPARDPSPTGGSNLVRNTCEWIGDGRIELFVMTPTHHWDGRSTTVPYFDATVAHPQLGGDYPADPAQKSDQVRRERRSTRGLFDRFSRTPKMYLFLPDDGDINKDEVLETLVHELQHHADQGAIGGIDSTGGTFTDASLDAAWARYKTEFRAFWLQPQPPASPPSGASGGPRAFVRTSILPSEFGSERAPAANDRMVYPSGAPPAGCPRGNVQTDFRNKRQEDIFRYLDQEGYGFESFYVCNDRFKALVDAFALPASLNPVNSVRIDDLAFALRKCGKEMAASAPEVQTALHLARELDDVDRGALTDEALSQPFWALARRNLSEPNYFSLRAVIYAFGKGDYSTPAGDERSA